MTPKEKAIELVEKMYVVHSHSASDITYYFVKECALIAVDFAMNSKYSFQPMHGGWVSGKLYYEEVKQEIEKL